MIKVTPLTFLNSYTKLKKCDICGKNINDQPFSNGVEVSYRDSSPATLTTWTYPILQIMYAHQGECEIMAVLQMSNRL
jgi:hypothetical protein